MKDANRVTKKDRERRHLGAFLRRIGQHPKQWEIIEERERPDFLLKSPDGDLVGVEMTELLRPEHGPLRTAEHRICGVIKEVVAEFIQSERVPGAIVAGNNRSVAPPHELRLNDLRVGLREHLKAHGQHLRGPKGSIDVPFEHEWGTVARIHRSENPGVDFWIDRPDHQPAYKRERRLSDIEESLLVTITDKVKKANAYSVQCPLWLAIRNPNQEVGELAPACIQQAQRLTGGRFARIVLFNDPEDVLDANPPPPHCVEIV
jgi:hypothetical protein